MKKLSLLLSLLAILSLSLQAEPKGADAARYGMSGCGFGSLVIKENKMLPQLGASTLNNFFGTYGISSSITSGTMNCTTDGIVKKEKEQEVYVYLNYENLEREFASGKGEKLDSFVSLFGCKNHKSEFITMVKKNYNRLFLQKSSTPGRMITIIKSEIKKDQVLSKSCNS